MGGCRNKEWLTFNPPNLQIRKKLKCWYLIQSISQIRKLCHKFRKLMNKLWNYFNYVIFIHLLICNCGDFCFVVLEKLLICICWTFIFQDIMYSNYLVVYKIILMYVMNKLMFIFTFWWLSIVLVILKCFFINMSNQNIDCALRKQVMISFLIIQQSSLFLLNEKSTYSQLMLIQ